MRIINWQTFIQMPPNTLFSKWEPCFFGPLEIKGPSLKDDTGEHFDFVTQSIADDIRASNSWELFEKCERAAKTGESLEIDLDCAGRDGEFNKDQMFAVWEDNDLMKLVVRLADCITISGRRRLAVVL